MVDRHPECVANWPECHSFGYDPRCCRFPKSCSADIVPPLEEENVSENPDAQEVDETGEGLLESVTKLGEAFEFVVEGIIAAAERARAVGSATVPLVAIDNLLLEYARRFINE